MYTEYKLAKEKSCGNCFSAIMSWETALWNPEKCRAIECRWCSGRVQNNFTYFWREDTAHGLPHNKTSWQLHNPQAPTSSGPILWIVHTDSGVEQHPAAIKLKVVTLIVIQYSTVHSNPQAQFQHTHLILSSFNTFVHNEILKSWHKTLIVSIQLCAY